MFLVDTEAGRIVEDEELKDEIARRKPYGRWLRDAKMYERILADRERSRPRG
jgi:glutamate synthase (NADPH/NADH) large chain